MNQTKTLDARMAELLEWSEREKSRCEQMACDLAGIDSECADACRFDAGVLYGYQVALEALQTGMSVPTRIAAGIDTIAHLNDQRSME